MSYPTDLLDELTATVGKGGATNVPSTELTAALTDTADAIALYCGRLFTVSASAARTFDAPASALLAIDDAVTITSVALNSIALSPTAYQLLPSYFTALAPCYTQIRLLAADGTGRPWNTAALAAGRTPYGDVTVQAEWGYSATPPGLVARATVYGAANLWRLRSGLYIKAAGGTADTGRTPVPQGWIEQDDVLVGWLRPYKKGG